MNYTKTNSGLEYIITERGKGKVVSKGNTIQVHYTGKFENGTKFDSSLDRNEPFVFQVGAGMVIKGWDEGFMLLREGDKAVLKIPSHLAYGEVGIGGVIPPNATLLFEVELLKIL